MWDNSEIDSFAVTAGFVEGPQSYTTQLEALFAVNALGLRSGDCVLDLPCGNGRHSIALARLGFSVTAVDVDSTSLNVARQWRQQHNVSLHHADVLSFPGSLEGYDAVLSFYSCLGYLQNESDDRAMLVRIASWVRTGGGLLLSTANRDAISRQRPTKETFEAGGYEIVREDDFCLNTGRLLRSFEITSGTDGSVRRITHVRRLYSPDEICAVLSASGLKLTDVFADFNGSPFDLKTTLHAVYLCRRPR